MAIKPVLRMGEVSLFESSEEVCEFNTAALESLLTDMWDTMAAEMVRALRHPKLA